eukprot:TRINITY_DN5249_c0_g2_i2.p2 TRINITY_DN5249_c0_g2~~TRINITY_DN5249_c0_g2_i2.p2  ORF type:complete len:198 (-),score=27.60 TRINITY_DN5249_c0_g2_i2:361-954(-)
MSLCAEPSSTIVPIFQLPEQNEDIISESAGMAMMFFGDVSDIPYGWQLCDGSSLNGLTTPDLRGRFPLGHSLVDFNSYDRVETAGSLGQTGGKTTKTLSINEMPRHSHGMSSTGSHVHWFDDYYHSEKYCNGADGSRTVNTEGLGSGDSDFDNKQCYERHTTASAGSHTHTIYDTGSSQGFEILPPYATVHFICRIK